MHRAGGVAFVDFAASAPYVDIDMHPADPEQRLDAVLWSPHKFLGGPGLLRRADLQPRAVPQHRARRLRRRHRQLDQSLGRVRVSRRHRGARGRRHAGLPADDQGRAGGAAQGPHGRRGDAAARGADRPAGDGRAAGDPRRARAGARAARAAGDLFVLRRDDPLQPDRAAAQRPLRRAGARRLLLRRHLRPLPAARRSLALALDHRAHRPRRPVAETRLGAAVVPPHHHRAPRSSTPWTPCARSSRTSTTGRPTTPTRR